MQPTQQRHDTPSDPLGAEPSPVQVTSQHPSKSKCRLRFPRGDEESTFGSDYSLTHVRRQQDSRFSNADGDEPRGSGGSGGVLFVPAEASVSSIRFDSEALRALQVKSITCVVGRLQSPKSRRSGPITISSGVGSGMMRASYGGSNAGSVASHVFSGY